MSSGTKRFSFGTKALARVELEHVADRPSPETRAASVGTRGASVEARAPGEASLEKVHAKAEPGSREGGGMRRMGIALPVRFSGVCGSLRWLDPQVLVLVLPIPSGAGDARQITICRTTTYGVPPDPVTTAGIVPHGREREHRERKATKGAAAGKKYEYFSVRRIRRSHLMGSDQGLCRLCEPAIADALLELPDAGLPIFKASTGTHWIAEAGTRLQKKRKSTGLQGDATVSGCELRKEGVWVVEYAQHEGRARGNVRGVRARGGDYERVNLMTCAAGRGPSMTPLVMTRLTPLWYSYAVRSFLDLSTGAGVARVGFGARAIELGARAIELGARACFQFCDTFMAKFGPFRHFMSSKIVQPVGDWNSAVRAESKSTAKSLSCPPIWISEDPEWTAGSTLVLDKFGPYTVERGPATPGNFDRFNFWAIHVV
ncbi:hypothetical protein DFH09DRAFT_1090157 [Mycena vulgaris]|nr:hypothetical protein DFH09DRAFT_1090157 [Mycena vulgaris]